MQTASNLGTIFASDKVCSPTLKQPAIQAFIAEKVDPADMGFANMLTSMIMGMEFQMQSMTPSAKTAHCAAITQSARHFGLID